MPRRLRLEAMEPRLLLIVNGTPTSDWPAVGQVGGASGTLIEGQYVLTAAHCASSVFTVGGTSYSVSQVYRHPNYSYDALGTDWANDIAVLKLSAQVPGITPIPILRSAPQVGGQITLVGFGAGGTDAGSSGGAGIKRAGVASLDGSSSTLVRLDFTVPGEANIAPGDSGGPGLVRVGNTYYVAGVHSCHTQSNSALGDRAYDTRVDAYASWIDTIIPAGASISVLGGGITIADGDATPAGNDGTDFGTVIQWRAGPMRTYTVHNGGTRTVSLGSVVVPAGYTLVEGLSPSLAAGASDTFTVQLTTAELGTASGDILFNTGGNDYNFRVTGSVIAGPGITVQPSTGLSTSESGLTATFTVHLDAAPTADVTIGLATSDATEGTVGPTSVTFTPGNWDTPQTVTVTGVDDPIADGSVAYKIVTLPATSSDPDYSSLNAADVSMTNIDNDPAIVVSPSLGLVTTESGGKAAFTVRLNTQPTGNVTIGVSSSDASEGTASAASLVFTSGNWDTPQTITVTGVDDPTVDGDVAYAIVTAPATSGDPSYSGLNAEDALVTNIDNDVAAIRVAPIAGLVTTESGGTATFTVRLDSEPAAEVTVGLASADTTEGAPGPASLTFTPGNWNTPQTVTVSGADDPQIDGNVAYTILVGPAASADAHYSGLAGADVSVTNNDNDVARITVVPSSDLVTTESDGKATFAIRLGSEPAAGVTIGLWSSDTTEGTPSAASVTLTAGNWNVFQTVTVTGVDDSLADGNVAYTIVTEPAASGDANYSGMNPEDARVTNNDNDPGIMVNPASGLVTTESGGRATFTVRLSTPPAASVTVGLATGDPTEGTVGPASLTFTQGNWPVEQTVTVGGLDDSLADGDVVFAVVLTPASSDPIYGGLGPSQASVTNLDNELAAAGADSPGLYDPASSWWYLRNSPSAGAAEITVGYGPPGEGWIPLAGDWNGDGVTTVGLYDPKTGYFYLHNSNTTGMGEIAFFYGEVGSSWLPVAGDWDGDGRAGVGLYDPATSVWYLRNSLSTGFADVALGYGPPGGGWLPLAGDWDGEGTETVGLYDPSSGLFYLRNSNSSGMGELQFLFGEIAAGWKPVVGDWNHDGRDTVGLYDPHTSVWYLTNSHSTGMADLAFGFGSGESGWLPVAGDWDGAAPQAQAADGRAVDQIDLRSIVARELGGDFNETVDGLLSRAIGAAEIDAVFGGRA